MPFADTSLHEEYSGAVEWVAARALDALTGAGGAGLFGDTALHEISLADTDHGAAFGRMWEDYARGILESVPTRQTGEDGKRAVEIVQAAYQSNATGKTVDLPLSID